MKSKIIISLISIYLIFGFLVLAGDRSNIRGMGMARTINAVSQSTDAIGINPANIAISDGSMITLSLGPTGVMARTELLSLDVYKKYFTGIPGPNGKRIAKTLTEEDKESILSQMPDDPRTKFGAEVIVVGFTFRHPVVGGIGFAWIDRAGFMGIMSKDFFRFAGYGLDSLGSEYRFDNTNFSTWWFREYNISYGRKLPLKLDFVQDLYAGISFKIIRGYGVFITERQNSIFGNYPIGMDQYVLRGNIDFLTRRSGVDFFGKDSSKKFELFPDPAGKGFGVDFGFSSEVVTGLRVALSFTDLGSITWRKNVFETAGGGPFNANGVLDEMKDTIETAFKGTTLPCEAFKTSLPATLRLGAVLNAKRVPFFKPVPGKLLIALDYTQGLNKSLGNTTIPRFSLGVEYRVIRFIPFRTGLAIGGGDMVRWAFGTGFNSPYFCLDIATEHFGMVFMPRSFQMISFSIGMKIRV